MTPKPRNIDEYIGTFPAEIQVKLEELRMAIQAAAPDAVEKISYSIPTFALHGNLVHFAAFKNHIGLYAMPTANEAFTKDLSGYKTGPGSVQFPLEKPLPLALIKRVVEFRVKENLQKATKFPEG